MSAIRDAITHLQEVEQLLVELGPLNEAHDKASARTETVQSALDSLEKELSDARSGLTVAQAKNLRDYEDAIFNRAQQVKDLDAKIMDKQAQLDDLDLQVASADARHKQLEASLDSLRKQHFG